MADFWAGVKQVIGGVAPMIGTALGGPLGGIAGAFVSRVLLGKEGASDEEIEAAIRTASPEQLIELKKAEIEFARWCRQADVDLARIDMSDRDSARRREMAVRDWTPAGLALLITFGFFGVLAYLLRYGKPELGGDALLVMLGSLGTAWSGVIAYYFGSTRGSDQKTAMVASALKQR